jgi:hypothetical protein
MDLVAELKEPPSLQDAVPPPSALKSTPPLLMDNQGLTNSLGLLGDDEDDEERPSVYTIDVVSRSSLPPRVINHS